ncbi:MAG: twin-arginine translocase subunit TatC [Thermodesulfobacteriota bacterium]|nr:MAG: twin-arginine translocase subunit TatC [Thermodesulfobacteriota bacterium]
MAEEEATAASITTHLKELRKRIIIIIAALAVGFAVSYGFSDRLYNVLAHPLIPALPEGFDFIAFTGVVEPFFVYIKVGFLGAIVLSSPVILYEAWAFVAPGLYKTERLWFLVLVLVSLALFISGVLFAFFVVFPFAFKYLLGYASEDLRPILSMNSYFSLVTRLLIAFGVIYQLPLAILVLARLGLVTAKQLISWWRYAVLAIIVASAIFTPTPDIFNQLLMAGPLLVLYALGVVVAKIFGKKKEAVEEEKGAVEVDEE